MSSTRSSDSTATLDPMWEEESQDASAVAVEDRSHGLDDSQEGDEFDGYEVTEIHEPILREQSEPRDGYEPLPNWAVALAGALLFWGGYYLQRYSGDFSATILTDDPAMVNPAIAALPPPELSPFDLGKKLFAAQGCVSCHQTNGQGVPNQYPPLDGSEWVVGPGAEPRLKRILLHGLQGPVTVKGNTYNGNMPAFGDRMDDEKIAAVLTYIRGAWSNQAPPIEFESVVATRAATQGRTQPWSESELLSINEDDPFPGAAPASVAAPAPGANASAGDSGATPAAAPNPNTTPTPTPPSPNAAAPGAAEVKEASSNANSPPPSASPQPKADATPSSTISNANAAPPPLTAELKAIRRKGGLVYALEGKCVTCHQNSGLGLGNQYPPLAGSEWVVGPGCEPRLKRIVLQGLQGPVTVKGITFNGNMPAHGDQLDDEKIAAVLTYIRMMFGNQAPPITPESVAATRAATKDRKVPWTEAELLSITEDDPPK